MNLVNFRLRNLLVGILAILIVGTCVENVLAQGRSVIQGFVFDKNRNALIDVDVELLNEYYQLRQRARTDASGRYEFQGLADGYYTVRVLPFRYDLEDSEQQTEIRTIDATGRGGGIEYKSLDFYLSPKKGGLAEAEAAVIFAQDVPEDARNAYKQAIKDLAEKRQQEGIDGLVKAITIYPEYFDALYRMGKDLYFLGKYDEAWRYLLKASEANPKSPYSFYYMGYSFYKLGKDFYKPAITSLKRASELAPGSMQVVFALGKVERSAGRFDEAEKHLLLAKKLAEKPVAEVQKELVDLYEKDLKKFNEAANELEDYIKAGKISPEEKKKLKEIIENWRNMAKTQNDKS